ncbi:MAG: hypothetical protein WA581_21520 [Candidatus Acidiferrales bacterium]
MTASADCDECRKIKLELREAWMDAWFSADEEFRVTWLALPGGTEEDAARAEELFPKANIKHKQAERLRQGVMTKFAHEAGTGHKIPLRRRGPDSTKER